MLWGRAGVGDFGSLWGLFAFGRGALAGQTVLLRLVGVSRVRLCGRGS